MALLGVERAVSCELQLVDHSQLFVVCSTLQNREDLAHKHEHDVITHNKKVIVCMLLEELPIQHLVYLPVARYLW